MNRQNKKHHFTSIENPPKGIQCKGDGHTFQLDCSTFNPSLFLVGLIVLIAAGIGFYFTLSSTLLFSLIFLSLAFTVLYFILTNAAGVVVLVFHDDLLIVNEKSAFSNTGFDIKISSIESVGIYNWRQEIKIQSNKGKSYFFGKGMKSEALWFLLFVIEKKMEAVK